MKLIAYNQIYNLSLEYLFCAVTGRYQVTGLLFLATENRANVQQGLNFFKNSLSYTPEDIKVRFHFIVDKDFDYIEVSDPILFIFIKITLFFALQVLHLVFPRCRVLLDSVHVERYFREKVFPGLESIYA